jgi:hypothetical protein
MLTSRVAMSRSVGGRHDGDEGTRIVKGRVLGVA